VTSQGLRLKHVATLEAGGTPRTDDPANWSDADGVPWVSISDMSSGNTVVSTEKMVSRQGVAAARLPIGDPGTVLLAMYATVGATAMLGTLASWNQAILGVVPRIGRTHSAFVRYWLESVRPEWLRLVRSNTQDNLNAEVVRNAPFPNLTLATQRAIADYLDTETARIDALASRYLELVDRLVDQRGAITVAGVGGGPLAVPRRASSLAWLTEVPAYWDEVRLSLLARLGSGHTPSREHPEWWVDCTIPWITTGEVRQIRDDQIEYLSETREKISQLGIANSSAELHPAATVVLSRTASAGFSAIMATDMATSQDYVTWTCGPRLRPRFLLLCLRAMRQDLLGRLARARRTRRSTFPTSSRSASRCLHWRSRTNSSSGPGSTFTGSTPPPMRSDARSSFSPSAGRP
jgi:type I restriction enzyme S subunit